MVAIGEKVGLQLNLAKTEVINNGLDGSSHAKHIQLPGGQVEVLPCWEAVQYLGKELNLCEQL